MKTLIFAACMLAASANATTLAFFTGNSRPVTTITGKFGMACEYEAYGRRTWVTFVNRGYCPPSIEVE